MASAEDVDHKQEEETGWDDQYEQRDAGHSMRLPRPTVESRGDSAREHGAEIAADAIDDRGEHGLAFKKTHIPLKHDAGLRWITNHSKQSPLLTALLMTMAMKIEYQAHGVVRVEYAAR